MITTQKTAEGTVVRPSGPITISNAHELQQELATVIEDGATNISIDLAEVDMIDSKGLSVFVQCYQSLQPVNGTLTVIAPQDDLQGLFRAMNLDQHFEVKAAA